MGEETFTGYIYKISSPHTDKVYVGSTIQTIKRRLQEHKSEYKRFLKGVGCFITSFEIIKLGNSIIDEIETLNNVTIEELRFRETFVIRNTENVVNTKMPRQTQTRTQYYQENKIDILEQKKNKTNCVCGSTCRHDDISRHNKTKKHLTYVTSLTPSIINITIQTLNINNK